MFGKDEVVKALWDAVEERGEDYVYPPSLTGDRCFYSNKDGSPSCGVGAVIARLDPKAFEAIRAFETETGESFGASALSLRADDDFLGIREGFRNIGYEFPEIFEEDAVDVLMGFQEAQDAGISWGEAAVKATA